MPKQENPKQKNKEDRKDELEEHNGRVEVALFPIPNVVAFPGVDLPLHVFEPRYRALVNDSVADKRMIGVCHTVKAIHEPHRRKGLKGSADVDPQDLEKMLNSNQTTYKPQPIFSAGHCEIIETLPDGRMLANVQISQRLTLIEERQSLPYRIVMCEPLTDDEDAESNKQAAGIQTQVHEKFVQLIEQENPEMAAELKDPSWLALSPADYSFKIFHCLRLNADLMQHVLEQREPAERLNVLWQLLQAGD